ncbi:hypothetical protein SADUNF_Sadunf08G0171800 [Salix dunnii]|uniref:DUF4219 domain-containing protein n=1 Tax=Salix dunnii TaxID=1413687 RepID=A0A835MT96_9ROSI|nr:hypothetical protein SADUNF_Sadunf08G0171800 [Salix dunnii]
MDRFCQQVLEVSPYTLPFRKALLFRDAHPTASSLAALPECAGIDDLNFVTGLKKTNIWYQSLVVKAMASFEGDASKTLAVVKPMVRGASIPIQYPTLSETNYGIWAVKMKIILRSLGV